LAARHPDWVVGYVDEVWWSRLAQPAMHAWGETLRLHAKARAKDDAQPKALACYGLLRTDQDRVLLRFVEGRPVSRVTTDFLAWAAGRLAAEGKRVWVLVWDNAAWHVSRAVQAWIGAHNRAVKRTGGVRILVCRLPVKSPWLNSIEPRWLHGKRAIVEPDGPLTAHQLMDRVHQHFRCEPLEPLHQHVL
jgi:DDE superfamily endonuclease